MKQHKLELPVGIYHCRADTVFHASCLGDLNIEIEFKSFSSYLPQNLIKNKHLLGTKHKVHAIRTSQVYTDPKMQEALNLYCFNVQYHVNGTPVSTEELINAIRMADITKEWQEFCWGLMINYGQGDYLKVFLDWATQDVSNLAYLSRKTKKYSQYELVFPEDTFGALLDSFEEHLNTTNRVIQEDERIVINHYVKAWKQFIADKSKRSKNFI